MIDALDISSLRIPKKELWPEGAFVRSKLGQEVLWLDKEDGGRHLSPKVLEPYRLLGDGPVDRIIEMLDKEGNKLGPGDDLLLMAEKALKTEDASRSLVQKELASFLETHLRVPDWVDIEQLKRGQDVHLAYLPAISFSLYYRSLIPGFSIPKIAAVIQSTAYLAPPSRPDQALQRLLDTGSFTVAVTGLGIDALLPGGIGWKSALHVRVLHAKVRYAILNRKGKRKWNVEELGIPINQEDMAATLLAFSANVLVGIDLIAGNPVSDQEHLDYLALWRYIGWLLGVETEFDSRGEGQPTMKQLPPLDACGPGPGPEKNPVEHSKSIFQSIIFHLLHPDESSVNISHHLLKVTDRKPPGMGFEKIPDSFYKNDFFYYRCFNCRRMVGDPLADALQLPLPSSSWVWTKMYLKSTLVFSLTRLYTNASRWIPPIRRWIIRWHTKAVGSFHYNWRKTHKSKMAYALAKHQKASIFHTEETAIKDNDPVITSLCPFAMTAEPT